MNKVVNLRECKLENNQVVLYKGGKVAGAYGFLDAVDQYGNEFLSVFPFKRNLPLSDFEAAFNAFIDESDEHVFNQALYKKCRGCFNVFHNDDINSEHGVCKKCERKVDGFKRAISITHKGNCIVGGFGGGCFISSHEDDDRFELAGFKCSLIRVLASGDEEYTIKSLFSDKQDLGNIEKNGENLFTAVYNKQGHAPLPDGLILLFYDVFLQLSSKNISNIVNETA